MKEVNEDFVVERSTIDAGDRSLVMNLGKASDYSILTIQSANDRRVIDYFSPASGKLVYAYWDIKSRVSVMVETQGTPLISKPRFWTQIRFKHAGR